MPYVGGTGTGSVASPVTTVARSDLIKRVRKYLEDEPWEDKLTAGYTSGTTFTSVTVNAPTKWGEGNIMEVDDNTGSQLKVTATPSANPVAVKSGHNDSADSNHSNGVVLLKNPRFSYDLIYQALTNVCNSDLWPAIYVVNLDEVTPVNGTLLYAAPTDIEDLVTVSQKTTGTPTDVGYFNTRGYPQMRLLFNVDADVSASYRAYRITDWFNTTNDIQVFYRAKINPDVVPDDQRAELVVLLACYQILGAKEVPFGGEDLRYTAANASVQSGGLRQDANWFRLRAAEVKAKCIADLRENNPPMKRYVR